VPGGRKHIQYIFCHMSRNFGCKLKNGFGLAGGGMGGKRTKSEEVKG